MVLSCPVVVLPLFQRYEELLSRRSCGLWHGERLCLSACHGACRSMSLLRCAQQHAGMPISFPNTAASAVLCTVALLEEVVVLVGVPLQHLWPQQHG